MLDDMDSGVVDLETEDRVIEPTNHTNAQTVWQYIAIALTTVSLLSLTMLCYWFWFFKPLPNEVPSLN